MRALSESCAYLRVLKSFELKRTRFEVVECSYTHLSFKAIWVERGPCLNLLSAIRHIYKFFESAKAYLSRRELDVSVMGVQRRI